MRILLVAILLLLIPGLKAQETTGKVDFFDPDDILISGEARPKVLLVGTFHMDYPNLDAHVIDEADQIDVKDDRRRAEMQQLLDYLAKFRPTKIVVERWPESNENDKYRAYLKGDFELGRNEIHQLAYRLAKRFGHEELVLADAGTMVGSFYDDPGLACLRPKLDSIFAGWDFRSDDPQNKRYTALYDRDTKAIATATLLENFKYMNSEKRILRGHGAYLVGDFKLGEQEGADALALHWYARNLRIYRNIQRAVTSPDDRVMVIFGAGHLGILRQQFESSPEFELVEFGDL